MESDLQVPLPLDQSKSNNIEDRRLWVGNLDLRINEYQLLKLVQQHGKIEKFDLLFHRSGPQAGQPRGYAFVTYETSCDAERAKDFLHNTKIGAKSIVVRWAHSVNENDMDKPKPRIDIPALAGAKKEDKKVSRETAIQAIEAKLKMMNESEEEFELNKPLDLEENRRRLSPTEVPGLSGLRCGIHDCSDATTRAEIKCPDHARGQGNHGEKDHLQLCRYSQLRIMSLDQSGAVCQARRTYHLVLTICRRIGRGSRLARSQVLAEEFLDRDETTTPAKTQLLNHARGRRTSPKKGFSPLPISRHDLLLE